jgi:chromate transporter
MPLVLVLFLQMAKIGLFAVGGGAVTIPFQQHLGESTGWFGAEELANMLAVAQSLPGAMGVNLAAYVGFSQLGPAGALVAVLGIVAPSIVVILVVASFLSKFRENRMVASVMRTIRPASLALLVAATLLLFSLAFIHTDALPQNADFATLAGMAGDGTLGQALATAVNWKAVALFAAVAMLANLKPLKRVHPFFWMLACAAAGVIFSF